MKWLCLILIVSIAHGLEVSPITSQELQDLLRDGQVRIFDARSDFEREMEGYITGSELLPMDEIFSEEDRPDMNELELVAGDTRKAVYVSSPGFEARKAESVLKTLGFEDARCFLEGIPTWIQNNGTYELPRFVKFKALNTLLNEDKILLIDVRNRSELNTVGQIPKSVCLPLHEVDLAFELPDEEFEERYQFPKPDGSRKDIVLTCRSGRRVLVADSLLKAKGYPHLRIYSGSFKDWVKQQGDYDFANFDLDYDLLT
eukprot:maker-scaffold666_size115941-snap-gene-0.9 protein:Tk06216 transcript:maker-scaffold666_size115941-snap-gene-0.9-mRNA-1 annotation:"heat shock protein 67b2"